MFLWLEYDFWTRVFCGKVANVITCIMENLGKSIHFKKEISARQNCVYHLPTLKVIKNEKDLPKLVVPLVAAAILLFLLFHQYIRAGDRSS